MSDEKVRAEVYGEISGKIVACLLLPFIVALSIYIDGCVLFQLWKWFGESTFGFSLNMATLCGFAAMINFIRCNSTVLKETPKIAPFKTLLKGLVVLPLFYYTVGYCIHTYM